MAMFDDLIPQEGKTSGGMFDDLIPEQATASLGDYALDAVKGAGVGLVQGVESIPATVPLLTGLAGKGVSALMEKFAPSLVNKEAEQNEAKLRQLAAEARGGGVAGMLPQPQTKVGEATKMVSGFVPSAFGLPGGIPRNLAGAVGGGLGAFGAGELAPSEEQKPYYEIGGALLGGVSGLRAADATASRLASRQVPEAQKILDVAGEQYKTLQSRTVKQPIEQEVLDNLADKMKTKLHQEGPRASVAEGVDRAINEMRGPAPKQPGFWERVQSEMSGEPVPSPPPRVADVADLVSARQNLKAFFQNTQPDPNKAGAAKILPLIDAEIERQSPGTAKLLREADANWSAGKTGKALDKRITRAELRAHGEGSGLNLGNKIRQQSANLLVSDKESRYLSDAQRQALTDVNKGTAVENLLQLGSRFLGGGGGAYPFMLGAGGLGAGYFTGHPELAALPIVGLGLRGLENTLIARHAQKAAGSVRAQAPYVQQLGISPNKELTRRETAELAALLAARGLLQQPPP